MDIVTKEFIEYYNDYLKEDNLDIDELQEIMGNWACKYCDDQDQVYEVLDEIERELKL